MNITLKQMKYFAALVEHGHFGRAASALAISQPALSIQIRDLEAELGQPLFERGPKGVQLTAFGGDFDTRARAILEQIDDLGQFARAASDLSAGHQSTPLASHLATIAELIRDAAMDTVSHRP